MHFVYGAITLYGQTFQTVRLCIEFLTSRDIPNKPHNPRYHRNGTGLGCSAFARRY